MEWPNGGVGGGVMLGRLAGLSIENDFLNEVLVFGDIMEPLLRS
jgi:hypothetical protein